MPGRRRVWAQPDGRRVWIPSPGPDAPPPPLRPPLPLVRTAASSEDALVEGWGGANGCRVQSMPDLLVQEQPFGDVPDAEGESSEMDTPFRGGVPPVFQTGSGKAVLLGKDSIQKARALLEDDKEKATHLRFLVSNTAAGCIFGKDGSTINDFQSQSGSRIQLSCSHEFFPGSNEAEARPKFKLLVPNSSCGGIIGKGGATIKSFIEDSHAGIKISPQDNNFVGLHDRLVTITGPLNSQMRAIYLILSKLSEDVHYPPNLSSPFPYAGLGFPGYPAAVPAGYIIPQVPYNDAVNYGPNGYAGGGGGRYQNNKPAATMAAAPPPTLPDDLIEEILLRLLPNDPASLLCASLVCKTWSHIAKVQLKRAQLQEQLKRAQLQLESAQLQLQLENARLQLLLEKEQLKGTQLQEELNQLQKRPASSSSRAPSRRRSSTSSRGGQPAAAQARPAWR